MTAPALRLRPVQAGDESLLFQIYASTRREELAALGWSADAQAAFLRQQFDAQARHYHQQYADADFQLVLRDDRPIGRLYTARWPGEIRLIDIALLPEHRNAGIGTHLIRCLMDEAALAGKPVRLHVTPFNPALRLYQRLGFAMIEYGDLYCFMEWTGAPVRVPHVDHCTPPG